jgi:predicted amidohydrolase
MPPHLAVALAQYGIDRDPVLTIQEAKAAGAELVVFPEMFSNGYARFDPGNGAALTRWREGAQRPDGAFVKKFREAANSHRMHVVATFLEDADPKPFNSALLIDPNGNTVLHHRKVHICDFDANSPDSAAAKNFAPPRFKPQRVL